MNVHRWWNAASLLGALVLFASLSAFGCGALVEMIVKPGHGQSLAADMIVKPGHGNALLAISRPLGGG